MNLNYLFPTPTRAIMLKAMFSLDEFTQSMISVSTGLKKTTIAKECNRLVNMGMIHRIDGKAVNQLAIYSMNKDNMFYKELQSIFS